MINYEMKRKELCIQMNRMDQLYLCSDPGLNICVGNRKEEKRRTTTNH